MRAKPFARGDDFSVATRWYLVLVQEGRPSLSIMLTDCAEDLIFSKELAQGWGVMASADFKTENSTAKGRNAIFIAQVKLLYVALRWWSIS